MNNVVTSAPDYRLLNWNEVVCKGDFVSDGSNGFELWEGPSGFRADAFTKEIFRRDNVTAVPKRKR